MTDALLECRGLHTYYGASHILNGVDFAVRRAESIGLMGRNGMGKTTLLRSLLRLAPTRRGEVRVRGAPVTHAAAHAIARQGTVYVPESRGIFPNLTVRENLLSSMKPPIGVWRGSGRSPRVRGAICGALRGPVRGNPTAAIDINQPGRG